MAVRKTSDKSAVVRRRFIRLRPRVLAGLALLGVLAYGGHQVWQRYAPAVGTHPQYTVTADTIHIPPPPRWIRSDLRREVLRDAGLGGAVSLLDDGLLLERLKTAFEFHPWVASVHRVAKRLPAGIDVTLEYRQPLAAVETIGTRGPQLLVVDAEAVRLPELDLTESERRYLPRITGVTGTPAIGSKWADVRVISGVRFANELAPLWESLRLMEIIPVTTTDNAMADLTFELLTTGGTRIIWGAAPGEELADESPFAVKLERLQSYASQHGTLDAFDGPESIDVRSQLHVIPRAAKKKGKKLAGNQSQSETTAEEPSAEVAARADDENNKR